MRKLLFTLCSLYLTGICLAQEKTVNPRPLTMAEYDKALTYKIADLDKLVKAIDEIAAKK